MPSQREREFADKVVIVTGASRGIGHVTARMFAERGASLILVGRNQSALQEAVRGLPLCINSIAFAVSGDVGTSQTAIEAAEKGLTEFGKIDILINVAGIFPTALLADTSDQNYNNTIATNLTGTFNMCRAVMPLMMRAENGAIVNTSSIAARVATPGLSVYAASKAGVEAFTRAIAAEAAPSVRVNAVSAGPIATEAALELSRKDETGAVDAVTRSIPLQRRGYPEEVAEAILFLASHRASWITGEVVQVNGGGLMA